MTVVPITRLTLDALTVPDLLAQLGHYVIPLLTWPRRTQTPFLIGTGTLLHQDKRVFLITARHVIERIGDAVMATSGRDGFVQLGGDMAAFEYERGRTPDRDICVVVVPPSAVAKLHQHHFIVDSTQLGEVAPYEKTTLYAFVGYPHSKNKPKPLSLGKDIRFTPHYFCLREFVDVRELNSPDKLADVHIAFSAPPEELRDISFRRRPAMLRPHGMSGGGVWKLALNPHTSAIETCAFVGVIIEYLQQDKAFVATRIHSALAAIWHLTAVASPHPPKGSDAG